LCNKISRFSDKGHKNLELDETDGKAQPLRDSKIIMLQRDQYVEEVITTYLHHPFLCCEPCIFNPLKL
jgi:hypothetical protein